MVVNRPHPLNGDDATIDQLRSQVGMSRDEARTLVKQEGLDGLRIRVAAKLYATEFLTSGEAANRVGLHNRGLLLQFLDENHIGPVPDPAKSSERVKEELDERMEARLKRWQSE